MGIAANPELKNLLKSTKLKEIMGTDVIKVSVDDPFSKVEELFINHGITHVMVVDYTNKLVGLISQKYVYKTQSPRKYIDEEMTPERDTLVDGDSYYRKEILDSYILTNTMQKDPLTLSPDDSVVKAVTLMAQRKLGCIPLVDKTHKICGLVTTHEIVKFIAQLLK